MKNKMSLFFLISLLSINIVLSEIYPLRKVATNLKTLHRKRRTSGKEDSFLENVYGDSHNLYYYYATLYLGKKKFLKLIYWTQEVLQLLLLVTNVVHVASI